MDRSRGRVMCATPIRWATSRFSNVCRQSSTCGEALTCCWRADVDPKRLAYVGHSYNAATGAFLAGIDKRFKAFVLMAGKLSDEVGIRSKGFQDFCGRGGPEKICAFMTQNSC